MQTHGLFRRYEGNPILGPGDVPGCGSIYNSAVVRFGDGFVGVFRVDDDALLQQLHVGWSDDGLHWRMEPEPFRLDWRGVDIQMRAGGFDPRVIHLEGKYYVVWCADYHGSTLALAETDDFQTFRFICNPLPPYNRNGVLFPRRINGKYYLLHRPSDRGHTPFGDIYVSSSEDLVHWGRHRFVFGPTDRWQQTKVGAGPVPIETDEGWLLIYHGVITKCNGFIYSVGAALLDLEQPWKVLHRTWPRIMGPYADYERVGDVSNTVFPCAAVVDDDTRELTLYYGAADTYVCVAYANLDEIVEFAKAHDHP
jgi:beta-1,4-mannooligosaccharide/beta-1,4-mannosyl-N-acetylglucosamine phosphorylase